MLVYVADIFATLLNHATKFKEVEIRDKVSTGESVSRIGFKRETGEMT